MTENDDTLLTAAERARQAEDRLIETPVEDPAIVPKAHRIYQRAEEVDALAEDAASGDSQDSELGGEPGEDLNLQPADQVQPSEVRSCQRTFTISQRSPNLARWM